MTLAYRNLVWVILRAGPVCGCLIFVWFEIKKGTKNLEENIFKQNNILKRKKISNRKNFATVHPYPFYHLL